MLSATVRKLTRDWTKKPGAAEQVVAAFLKTAEGLRLPADYLAFMRHANGASGQAGRHGLWARLEPLEEVPVLTRGCRAPAGFLLLGGNELGHALALDGRGPKPELITVSCGDFDLQEKLGHTLGQALLQLRRIGRWRRGLEPKTAEEKGPDIGFVPSPQGLVEKMLKLARVTKDDLVYDLGCGDGRFVITAAKQYGARGVGFDVDPRRVEESRANVAAAGVGRLVKIRRADIFTLDLSAASVITLYLVPTMNQRLLPQFQKLRPGARIVSNTFDMAGAVKPKRVVTVRYVEEREGRILLWEAPLKVPPA
jgi:Methyltransferase domain